MPGPTHTALIVAIPEAEPAVAAHRATLDRAASWGVPAHITVLYPFLPPDAVTPDVLATLRRIAATVTRFDLTLATTAWFADTVVWLAPTPATPFTTLTQAVTNAFPQAKPYEGAHDQIVPHLTIGHDHPRTDLAAAETAVTTHLPITATVTDLHLIAGTPTPGGPWHTVATLPFAPRLR
jgi:2'-5' RNA ligase